MAGVVNICDAYGNVFVNKDVQYFIDITPCGEERTWAQIYKKLLTVEANNDVSVDNVDSFEGMLNDVTSKSWGYSFTTKSDYSDPALKYIIDTDIKIGKDTKTNFKVVYPYGKIFQGAAIIALNQDLGGDPSQYLEVDFDITFDGDPEIIYPSSDMGKSLGALPTPTITAVTGGSNVVFNFATVEKMLETGLLNGKINVLLNATELGTYTVSENTTAMTSTLFISHAALDTVQLVMISPVSKSLGVYDSQVIDV